MDKWFNYERTDGIQVCLKWMCLGICAKFCHSSPFSSFKYFSPECSKLINLQLIHEKVKNGNRPPPPNKLDNRITWITTIPLYYICHLLEPQTHTRKITEKTWSISYPPKPQISLLNPKPKPKTKWWWAVAQPRRRDRRCRATSRLPSRVAALQVVLHRLGPPFVEAPSLSSLVLPSLWSRSGWGSPLIQDRATPVRWCWVRISNRRRRWTADLLETLPLPAAVGMITKVLSAIGVLSARRLPKKMDRSGDGAALW